MKKKSVILMLSACLWAGIVGGCADYLDVNHDPDTMEEVPSAKVLLPTAQLAIANNLMGWNFGFGGAFWVQYWTQSYTASQFKTLCEYQPESFDRAYRGLYVEGLNNLKRIKTLTADTATEAAKAYNFIAEALSIFSWQIITDVWGDVPYFEALKGDEGLRSPKFDTQQAIYADLQQRVDALLQRDLSEAAVPSVEAKYDFINAGDIDEWVAFAGALKLKLMLRLSETQGYNNAAVLAYIEDPNTTLLAASAKVPRAVWTDNTEGKRHPMREFQLGSAGYLSTNVKGCKSFVDYLNVNSDPRLAKLFSGTKAPFFGDFDSKVDSDGNGTNDDKETYCTSQFQATVAPAIYMDLMLMSEWEVNFYIAEVYARASDFATAKTYYDAAVTASLTQQDIAATTIIGAGGYAEFTATSTEQAVEQIAMQKWVANCNYQHIESALERNRTKYPAVDAIDIATNRKTAWTTFPVGKLTLSVTGRALLNDNMPASPIYPEDVMTRNLNAPGQKPNIAQKVWWDQKAGK
jgi:hypothetical protein